MASLTHSLTDLSKFYGTSISVAGLKICLHLGLGVELRGKLEQPNICHAKYRKKIMNKLTIKPLLDSI